MKTKDEVVTMMLAVLAELQSGTCSENLSKYLTVKLETIVDILDDDVPKKYWEQLEKFIAI